MGKAALYGEHELSHHIKVIVCYLSYTPSINQ